MPLPCTDSTQATRLQFVAEKGRIILARRTETEVPNSTITNLATSGVEPASNKVRYPAGLEETRLGAGLVALKGKMFELFAYGLCGRPEAWNEVLTDPTAETFLRLVEAGRGQL